MTTEERQREVAERLRLAAKELRWAAANIESIYDMVRPVDMPPFEDKNQMKIEFDDTTEV